MKYLITCLFCLLFFPSAAATSGVSRSTLFHKSSSGITGRLTDPTGAVVAGAPVRIIACITKRGFSFKTNSEGEYVADLDPDVYDVEVEVGGFKKAKRKSIEVLREARSYVDFVLEPLPPTEPYHP